MTSRGEGSEDGEGDEGDEGGEDEGWGRVGCYGESERRRRRVKVAMVANNGDGRQVLWEKGQGLILKTSKP